MGKLITPLGVVAIYNNATEIKYEVAKLDCNSDIFPDIDGRYKIIIEYENDMFPHLIYCALEGIDFNSIKSYNESGEGLDCKAFYQDNIKLSIGIEADTDYIDGKRISRYDYDNVHLHNSLGYHIFPTTKSQKFVFGVAWIKGYNEANEVQTWYAADPTIM